MGTPGLGNLSSSVARRVNAWYRCLSAGSSCSATPRQALTWMAVGMDIIGALAHIDVIVRMHPHRRPTPGQVSNDLVGIHVSNWCPSRSGRYPPKNADRPCCQRPARGERQIAPLCLSSIQVSNSQVGPWGGLGLIPPNLTKGRGRPAGRRLGPAIGHALLVLGSTTRSWGPRRSLLVGHLILLLWSN